MGNQFLSNIRSCNAICHVVRAFDDPNVQHVDEKHDPKSDIEIINTELVLADLQTLQKVVPRMDKEARANPKLRPEVDLLSSAQKILDSGQPLWTSPDHTVTPLTTNYQLLTTKPVIYMFNVDEATLTEIGRASCRERV